MNSYFLVGMGLGLFLGIGLPIVDIISIHYIVKRKKGKKNEKGD